MHDDLQRLIALQRLDSTAHDAERRLAEEPERQKALDARLDAARQQVAAARAQLTENQNTRRAIEKEVAVHEGRLSKFRDQAMAVKTNQEFHAIQHEIAFAQANIKQIEDRILELMVEADELTAAVKRAENELAAEQKLVDADRKALAAEQVALQAVVERSRTERASLVVALDPTLLATFEQLSRRGHGIAIAEAKDGICTICHVRLRPQVFNTVRRNDSIVQCDSCHRILYFVPVAPAAAAAQPASS